MSILIKNAKIIKRFGQKECIGDILINEHTITNIGINLKEDADEIIDAANMIALPGLINCHNHAAMTLFRGYSDDLRLMEWLKEKIWPAEDKLTGEDIYWGSLLGIAEMISTGTTTFADMYYYMENVAKAVEDSGIRASLCRGIMPSGDLTSQKLKEAERLVEKYHHSSAGRITCMFGPHAPFTCPPDFLKTVMGLAEKYNVPIHIHLAETSEEVDMIYGKYGKSPTKYLYDLGLFKHHLNLAHSVNLSYDDVYLLKGMKGGISHNPVSNMKLGCGVAPILFMHKLGITTGMGTDGAGSASTLDMFEEMKAAAWMQKNVTSDPTAISADTILSMATEQGAKVLNIDSQVGTLEIGKKADVILIDENLPGLYPHTDNLNALLAYSCSGYHVKTSIINGKIVMRDREILTFDVKEVLRQSQKIVDRIL